MQRRDNLAQEKMNKTMKLLVGVNAVLALLALIDDKLYILAAIAANAALIHALHELGKQRRPGSNTINSINTLFSSQTEAKTREIDNAMRNIVNGGAAIHDEIVDTIVSMRMAARQQI